MTEYKLYYFNLRGRAELARLILAYAGVDYEDVRIERSDWPQHKSRMPFGQIPVLEVDGQLLSQSHSIARFLARRFQLTGKDEWEAALADSHVDFIFDISSQVRNFIWEQDPQKQREMAEKYRTETLNPGLLKIEQHLQQSTTGFLVGNQITWADLALFNFFDFISLRFGQDWLSAAPLLTQLHQKVGEIPQIQKWVQKRPQSIL